MVVNKSPVILKGREIIASHPERLNGKYKVDQPSCRPAVQASEGSLHYHIDPSLRSG
jgi:hypothetical protein